MHRYQSNPSSTKKQQEQRDSIITSLFEEFNFIKLLKQLGIVFLISIIAIITFKILIPPEFIIFIKDSKGYRIVEIFLSAMILILFIRSLITKIQQNKPNKYGFVQKRVTKEQYQRECLRTTKTEVEKLMQSKEYLKWKESSNNRQNSSYKESGIDKEDEIVFSDEE